MQAQGPCGCCPPPAYDRSLCLQCVCGVRMPHAMGHVQEPDSAVAGKTERSRRDPSPAGAGVLGSGKGGGLRAGGVGAAGGWARRRVPEPEGCRGWVEMRMGLCDPSAESGGRGARQCGREENVRQCPNARSAERLGRAAEGAGERRVFAGSAKIPGKGFIGGKERDFPDVPRTSRETRQRPWPRALSTRIATAPSGRRPRRALCGNQSSDAAPRKYTETETRAGNVDGSAPHRPEGVH